jgi:hypothetical protein
VKKAYLETIALVERLHRECLEVIKADLDRQGIRDLNNVQAMILFNIGEDVLSVGELTNRGYYLGSNVTISAPTSPTTSRRWWRTATWFRSARRTTVAPCT